MIGFHLFQSKYRVTCYVLFKRFFPTPFGMVSPQHSTCFLSSIILNFG